jgi:selenium metabolism protein YedF
MATDPNLLVMIKSSSIGDGEPDLGERLMRSFLGVLAEREQAPAQMIFMGSGIFLTTEGSAELERLQAFVARGTTILSCTTCLEYYGRMDKLRVGRAGTMRDSVDAMLSFSRVLTP